jgi:hypothetical protein
MVSAKCLLQDEVTAVKRAAQQHWPAQAAAPASKPQLAAACNVKPHATAPGSAQPAGVHMDPLPAPAAMPPVLRACSTPSPVLSQLCHSCDLLDSLGADSPEQPSSAQSTPVASPAKPAESVGAVADPLRPGLSPSTALAMLPRAPPSCLQRSAPLVTSPLTGQGAAAAAASAQTPDLTLRGVGIAVLLSPQLHAPPGSGSGCGVLPARRPASGPRASARPCPIPRRRTVSPGRPLDFDAVANAPKGGHGCSGGNDSNGAVTRIANISMLQTAWQHLGPTAQAGAALPAAVPLQPQALAFQPGSKPSQRAGLSPLLAASLAEEAAAASQVWGWTLRLCLLLSTAC